MMSYLRRSVAVVASAAVMTLLMTGGYPLGAQESGTSKIHGVQIKTGQESRFFEHRRWAGKGQVHGQIHSAGSNPPRSPRLRQAGLD